MTDVVIHQQTDLAIHEAQQTFTDPQRQALAHIGVENASDADLRVFFHVVKRTGLDPFARQIYMIGRNTFDQRSNKWVTKQTIQTGIDGYRLIGRRAADRSADTVAVGAPEWAHDDGSWRQVWVPAWGIPIAARITVHRAGQPFVGVALFEEYKQTKKDGNLTQMWVQRPAGQIAKCAEALAWRLAFPQDLSGVYVEEEMHQATNAAPQAPRATAADFALPVAGPEADQVTKAQLSKIHAGFTDAGITDRNLGLAFIGDAVGRDVASSKDLSKAEASKVIDALESQKAPLEQASGYDDPNGQWDEPSVDADR